MANPLDTIKKNFGQSQLGQAVAGIPQDDRTPDQKIRDMIAGNPNTPAPVSMANPVEQAQPVTMPAPVQPQGPSPASVQSQAPQGNWAIKANPSIATSPIAQVNQIANSIPMKGVNMQMNATQGIGNAQAEGFADQERMFSAQEQELKASQERAKKIQDEKDTYQADFEKKYDEAASELKDTQIDSDRLWNNRTTSQKILTGIGLALSAFGGPEAVARTNQIIQGAIDKDIDEQKANYGIKKEGLQDMKGVYARMMDKFGDKDKAEGATRAFYNDLVKNKVDQISARTNNKVAKENANNYVGQLQSQKDSIAAQLMLTAASNANKAPLQYNQVIPDNYTPRSDDEAKRYIPGVGLATDAESAKTLRASTTSFNKFNDSLGRYIALREQYGSETLPSAAKGELKQLKSQLILSLKDVAKLGVMSETDFELLNDIIPDGTSYDPTTLSKMKALKDKTVSQFSREISPMLMNPVQSLPAKLKRGSF